MASILNNATGLPPRLPPKECLSEDAMQVFLSIIMQMVITVAFYRVVYFVVKYLGQPRIIAQLLTGVLLGPSGLSQNPLFKVLVFGEDLDPKHGSTAENNTFMIIKFSRLVFMLLVGLEIDQNYMRRAKNRAAMVIGAGTLASFLVVQMFQNPLWTLTIGKDNDVFQFLFFTLVFSSTASPIVVRMTTELKMATMEVGRVAISSSFYNDMFGLCASLLLSLSMALLESSKGDGPEAIALNLGGIVVLLGGAYGVGPLTRWLNRQDGYRKELGYNETATALLILLGAASVVESISKNGMLAAFVFGALMPREGKTVRTLTAKLTYPVNSYILPIYFSSLGLQANLSDAFHIENSMATIVFLFFAPVAKMVAIIVTTNRFGMPWFESLLLSLLLSAKGHIDIAFVILGGEYNLFSKAAMKGMISAIVVITLVVSPTLTILVKFTRRSSKYTHSGLEGQRPDSELRLLACIHSPRELPTFLNLLEASKGTDRAPLIAFMVHLIELNDSVAISTQLFYHQYEDFDEYEYGRDDAIQINNAVDCFNMESGITIRQLTAIADFSNMHRDVISAAQEIRAAMIIVPFHRRQAVDGKMDAGNEGIRLSNKKLVRNAKCSVAILVDRGLGGTTQMSAMHSSSHIAVLFFGGPDDREALAYGCRMADHPNVSVTVIRFQPASARVYETGIGTHLAKDDEILMSISDHEQEADVDGEFLLNFYNRYVVTGIVSFVEKFVENGAETVSTLTAMEGMFSLFVVGKGGRGLSPLTTGISEWEEYPELGAIGDLLASSDFTLSGSVLVVQQYGHSRKDLNKDGFNDPDDLENEFAVR